ncbi:MAG: hypothetical protein NTU49_00975, partial [Gammaproteobacteria bacterium]|nr:hypothetical protein [Gammaproteobacteria bacterium]
HNKDASGNNQIILHFFGYQPVYKNGDIRVLVEKIFQLLLKNGYATRDKIIEHSVNALGKTGLMALEIAIQKNENKFGEHTYPWIYKAIADGLGDVDKYIEIVKKYSVVNDLTVCDIAKRLISKWRSQEAIDWLLYQPNDVTVESSKAIDPSKITHFNSDRFDLLLEAYESETLLDEAQSLRWILFKRTLSHKYYEGLIKHKVGVELEKIKEQAFQFACDQHKGSIGTVLRFLSEIAAFKKIDEIVQEKFDDLSEDDYYLYRPLSKTLSASGFSLSACLLRRKLIDGILNRAISKYYKYAVSDLNLSAAYAKEVQDWKSFQNHDQYMENLRKNHGRKSAFWAQVKENEKK